MAGAEQLQLQATVEGSRVRTAKAKKQLSDRQADLARSRREVHFLARQLGKTQVACGAACCPTCAQWG